jgi:spermidine synthase
VPYTDRRPEIFGLALGLYATLAQVTLMREALTVAGGNELAVGLGFAAWLICVGLGAAAAAPIERPRISAIASGVVAGPIAALGLLVLRANRALLDLEPGADPNLGQLSALLACGLGLGGLTVGFSFTAAARSLAGPAESPVSRLYTFEALGALVGGLAFTFVIAGNLAPLAVLGAAGTVLAAAGAALARSRLGRVIPAVLALIMCTATILVLPAIDRNTQAQAHARLGAGHLVASAESAYGRLALGESEDQHQLLSDGRIDYAFPDPWERAPMIHTALAQHPRPERVLLIGGGAPDTVDAALSHRPQSVVLTYLDQKILELCRPFWPASTKRAVDDRRVTVVRDDGRRFVERTDRRFDVVVVTARPPLSAQANRYHTVELYTAVSEILEPGGSMTAVAPGGANVLAPEAARAAASTVATVGAVLPHVVLVPGLKIGIHAAAEPGVVSDDPTVLSKRFEDRGVEGPGFSSRRFATLLDESRITALRAQLEQWPAEINTDARPLAYLANLQLWERSMSRAGAADAPTWTGVAERWAWAWIVVPLLLWAAWRGLHLARGRTGPHADAVFSIATTGAAGMAAEVLVLYAFQAASGRLYTGLALLVGLFMAGLAAGAYLGRRMLTRRPGRGAIVAEIAALLMVGATGPVLALAIDLPWIIAAWSGVAGAITGAAFPALLALAAEGRGGDERRAAARIEAADHLGAALGALITSLIWLPAYGIVATCLLLAAFKAASLGGLLLGTRRGGDSIGRALNR